MRILDFSARELRALTNEEEILELYKEIKDLKETGIRKKDSKLIELAKSINQTTIKNTIEEEIIRIELYVTLKLAEKYVETLEK
jgi:hypothetical protein